MTPAHDRDRACPDIDTDDLTEQYGDISIGTNDAADRRGNERWSHFLTQPAKVDLPMQRTNHHEDAKTVFG